MMSAIRWVVIALLGGALCLGAGWKILRDAHYFPLRNIKVQRISHDQPAPLMQVNATDLQQHLADVVTGGFFEVNLTKIRQITESIPWVRHAVVRRIWPDSLLISIEEHQALGIWEGLPCQPNHPCRILSAQGLDLPIPPQRAQDDLPLFSGDWQVRAAIGAKYLALEPILLKHGLKIQRLAQSGEIFYLTLTDSLVVILHSTVDLRKLSLFAGAYPMLRAQFPAFPYRRVDLRYRNGFVLQ